MPRLALAAVLALALGLAAAGCGDDGNGGGTTAEPPLVGTTWVLERASAPEGDVVPDPGKEPTLKLTEKGTSEVFFGCNRGGGAAKPGDGVIEFGPQRMTMMACVGTAAEVEAVVAQVLDGTVDAEQDGDALTLSKDGRSLTYRAG